MKAFTLVTFFGILGAVSAAVIPQERSSSEFTPVDPAMAKRCGYGGRRDIEPECIPKA
ncbi:unnamed protein product [Rhizoctonia solani]|uniref:Uncharacterized protein n=1 Tax=Rhizoctonia solani TaxID=456999 RepID=A0A8H3H455_9AGAM|nr:unnamed protein product [Rhizoctonia solani]